MGDAFSVPFILSWYCQYSSFSMHKVMVNVLLITINLLVYSDRRGDMGWGNAYLKEVLKIPQTPSFSK